MPRETQNERPLLIHILPELANELRNLLIKEGKSHLAEQVSSLQIYDRCRCGDNFCASFYTAPPPKGSYGESHYNIALEPDEGYFILDIVEEKIVYVEVLYRDDIEKALRKVIG